MDENKTQQTGKNLKVLRTYTSDMAEAVRTNEMSVIKIALAEKERRENEELYQKAEGTSFSKTLFIIGGVIFIALAIYGSYFLFQKKEIKENTNTSIAIETFISYDEKSYLNTTAIKDAEELSILVKKEMVSNPDKVKALFLTKDTETIPQILDANSFLSLIDTTAPGALTRFLAEDFLFGKYSSKNSTGENPDYGMFLIFKTTDYNQSYASMLEWEKTMLKDLDTIFDINISDSNKTIFEKQWKDVVINNKDARVLYDEEGKGVLYYVFVNKNNFVIASNLETLKEIISRILIKNMPI